MKVIHTCLWIKKLFTLKRSCNLANSTLKRSWVYAETLLHSLYTYIYLYKKSCSCQLQAVNNEDKYFLPSLAYLGKDKAFLFALLTIFILCISTGCCQKTIYICKQPICKMGVIEKPATSINPPQFYLCGNARHPCLTAIHRQHVFLHHANSSTNQPKKERK